MLLARVIGTATSTVRHASMKGWKLLIVQPLAADGSSPDGEPVLAVDAIGAGLGDEVIVSSDGQGTQELLKSETTPVRWSVLGLPDR
jgi:ethanolamine utilization protein EutN